MSDSSHGSFVQTKSSLSRPGIAPQFQEVVFSSYKSKAGNAETEKGVSKKRNGFPDPIPKSKDPRRAFMKKARFDVIKFGLKGFDSVKKEETKQALAISLGAIPKKQKAINYKDLKEQRKRYREEERQRKATEEVLNRTTYSKITSRMQASKPKQTSKSKGGILNSYGKVKKDELRKK